jgi:hypothetical protein
VNAKKGVEPHPRRERNGVVGVESHYQRRYCGGYAGRDEYSTFVHARIPENLRVHEHDVDHGQKSRQAGNELGVDVGTVFSQPEIAINNRPFLRLCNIGHRSPSIASSPHR